MTKRRLFLFMGFLALTGLVLGVMAMLPPQPSALRANFDRVEKGMTRAEVEAILGASHPSPVADISYWGQYDGAEVKIAFDDQKRVTDKSFQPSPETFTDKLRRWFHLQ